MRKRILGFGALIALITAVFSLVPSVTLAYVQRNIDFAAASPTTTPTSVSFSGTVKITSILNPPGNHAPIKLKVKWGPANGQYTNTSANYIVNQASVPVNSPISFTADITGLSPGTSYKFAFFDESDPSDLIATPPAVQTDSGIPEIEMRKNTGSYGNTPELSYNAGSMQIQLAGFLRSSLSTFLSLEIHVTKTGQGGGQTQVISGPGIFSQAVVAGQEYSFHPTITGLQPSSNYAVAVFIPGQGVPLWSEGIDTEQASASDHIITGGPYGTTLLPLDPNCTVTPLQGMPAPAITGRCITITLNNDLTVAMDSSGTDRQATGTAGVKVTKAGLYDVGLVWGDSPSSMDKLWENPVFTRVMNAGDTDTLTYVMHSLLPDHNYYYTFVDFSDPSKALMTPVMFKSTLTPQTGTTTTGGTTSGGGGTGGVPGKPLVLPGNLVPCDGSAWQPCKFTHVMQLINNAIKWIIVIAIPILAIGFLYIGFLFVFKGGSEEARGRAKHVIINMLIGVVCILGAWLIVNTILDSLLDSPTASDYKLLE